MLRWGKLNTATYNVLLTKAVFFLKSHQQRLNKQFRKAEVKVELEKVSFNKEAIYWLEIWLNSQFKFTSHINEKVKIA